MEYKRYKIKTIEDILKAVNPENVEMFLIDFSHWLQAKAIMDDLQVSVGIQIQTKPEFNWIDDGKNDINVKIEFTNKPSPQSSPPPPQSDSSGPQTPRI